MKRVKDLSSQMLAFLAMAQGRPGGRSLDAYDLAPSTIPRGRDPEAITAAEAKRARKLAKRRREAGNYED